MSMGSFLKRNIYWIYDYLRGRKVRGFYDELMSFERNYEAARRMQEKRLHNLLEYAVHFSSFYKGLEDKPFEEYPVMNKTLLLENYEFIKVDDRNIPEQEEWPVHIQRTSGSTGTPFAVPQDSRKRYYRIAELKYYNYILGVKSHEMIGQLRIWGKDRIKGKWQSFRENIIPLDVRKMDESSIRELFAEIRQNKMVLLRGYGSWYDQVAQYIQDGLLDIKNLSSVKVCISSSDALSDYARDIFRRRAGVPVVEAYVNEENGVLAQQREDDDKYYLNHYGYKFEFLRLDSDIPAAPGELARIVVTDLFNYAFPMIRYDTGDTAIYAEGNPKSHGWVYMEKMYGRRRDLIYDVDGNPMHPASISIALKKFNYIQQWQVVQKGRNKYVVKLNLCNRKEAKENLIREELISLLGSNADIMVEYVDEIPVLASGKRKTVVCESID